VFDNPGIIAYYPENPPKASSQSDPKANISGASLSERR
jgi:hypothetical protein